MMAHRETCLPPKFHKCMYKVLEEINTLDESLYGNDGSWLDTLATHSDLGEDLVEDRRLSNAGPACSQ